MNNQTTEQLKSIVAGAPEGAEDYFVWDGEFSYGMGDGFFNGTTKCESLIGAKPSTRLLSDMREIIALRESNEGLKLTCKGRANSINEMSNMISGLQKANAELEKAIHYASDYLDDNKLNSIGSGSKAHMELREALKEQGK